MSRQSEIASLLTESSRIALIAHINPDGDAIGSVLALRCALEENGHTVDCFCRDKVPDQLHFLPGWDNVRVMPEEGEGYDAVVSVDVSTPDRCGPVLPVLEAVSSRTGCIDHHLNNGFMEINCVDSAAAAAGCIVYRILTEMGLAISENTAVCLYTAISTDTGNFCYTSTGAESFAITSELMKTGFPLNRINYILFHRQDMPVILLLRRALDSQRFDAAGRIAGTCLMLKDFEESGALQEHAESFVNYSRNVSGVIYAYSMRETAENEFRFSLRCADGYRVDGLAVQFGGGGHEQAAGCTICAPAEEARAMMVRAMEALLSK